jgi:hypothetical protein
MDPITVGQLAAALQELNVELLRQVLVVLGSDHTAEGLSAQLSLPSIGCTAPLAEVYERRVFAPDTDPVS